MTSQPTVSVYRRVRRFIRVPLFPGIVLLILVACALLAPWLAPHDPTTINILNARIPPGHTIAYPLGTDLLGRDVLSRVIYGARTSVLIALAGLGLSALLGTSIGMIAGYYGGRVDTTIMRLVDVALAFPTILAALVIAVLLGPGLPTIVIAVVATMWAKFARMVRGDVLSLKTKDYVTLARIAGVSAPVIMVRHLLPNILGTLMVITSLLMGQVILMEASLSFLGLGLAPGAPAWGIMVAEGRAQLVEVWWLAFFPGAAITVVVMALNLLGDWLTDALDPRFEVV